VPLSLRGLNPLRVSSGPSSGGPLDLTHSGAPAPALPTAHIDIAAIIQDGEDQRGDPGSPAEPEEGGRGLGFAAAALRVGGAVGYVVCACVCLLWRLDLGFLWLRWKGGG
jgi:hypothetical protein